MIELALCNADEQPPPYSCAGPEKKSLLPKVKAPDRRPARDGDLDDSIHYHLYPKIEQIRL